MLRKLVLGMMIGCLPLQVGAAEQAGAPVGTETFGEEVTGVYLREISENGDLVLHGRVMQPGDLILQEQMESLLFVPREQQYDCRGQIGFIPVFAEALGQEQTAEVFFRGKENRPPVAEDGELETYKNLENRGKLTVKDPEGDPFTCTVVRQPRRGTVEIKEDGSFVYSPKENKVGIDSFTYTAQDEKGNVSNEGTVTIHILKPTEDEKYSDTAGKPYCFAAEWMKNTGIFAGETVGGVSCFSGEKPVTRGEFYTMAVKALGLPVEQEVNATAYDGEVPMWFRPYLAAAARSGLTTQLAKRDRFAMEETMTAEEAAVMVCTALALDWQESAAETAARKGLFIPEGEALCRADAAMLLYDAARRQGVGLPQPQ